MAAGNWKAFTRAKRYIGTGAMTLNAGVFKLALHGAGASANLLKVSNGGISTWASVGSEIAATGGYVSGGKAITPKWTVGSSVNAMRFTFTANGLLLSAVGGNLTNIKYAVLRNSTGAGAGKVLCYCTLSTLPFTVASGSILKVAPSATGCFEMGVAAPGGVGSYPLAFVKPPSPYVYAAGARTDHPRLLITSDTLPLYRSWAVNTNPRWNDLLAVANSMKADYNSGAMYANDPGLSSGGFTRSDGARVFALMSLIDPTVSARAGWATLAHTVLMDLINIMVLGAISTSPQTPFRDPAYAIGDAARSCGEALPMAADWIYASLTSDDKAKIRQVFLRQTQERINGSTNFLQKGVYYNPVLRTPGLAFRQAGNNYICCFGRNTIAAALCLDAADDVPARTTAPAGYDTVPAGALTGMVNGYIGMWAYQREWFETHDTAGGFSQEGVEYGTSSSMGACALGQALLATTRHDDEAAYGSYAGWGNHQFWNNDFPLGFCHSFSAVLGTVPGLPYSEYLPLCYGDIQSYSPAEGTQLFAGVCLRARAKGIDATDQMAQWWMQNFTYAGPTRLSAYLRSYSVYGAHLAINAFLTCDPTIIAPDPRPALPLNVYGAGLGRMISRDQWGANGRSVDTVCEWGGTDHIDSSQGGFEYYRKGEWLTKFCNGYGVGQGCSDRKNIMSLENTADPNDHWYSIDDQQHGSQYIYVMRGDPTNVQAFGTGYAYQQMVLTELYNEQVGFLSQHVTHASRSLFYLKPDLIFLYDRAASDVANRYKRLHLNAQNVYSIQGNVATSVTPGGQKLFVTSLLPSGATLISQGMPVIDTGDSALFEPMTQQVRIEDATNPLSVRFLTVVEGADSGGARTAATLIQSSAGNPFDGVLAGGVAVMFKNDITAAFGTTTFSLPTAGTTAVYVTGLTPGAGYGVATSIAGASTQFVVTPGGGLIADSGGVIKAL